MNPDNLIVEARAKIIWGESPSTVHHFLTTNGMTEADAEAKIKEFILERNEEIRKTGIRKSCIGALMAVVSGILLCVAAKDSKTLFIMERAYSIGLFVMLELFGLWMLLTGLINIFRPESEKRSITDLAD